MGSPFPPEKAKLKHAMLWLDLETTGLDTDGAILEVAAVLTDMDLNEIKRKTFVIGRDRERTLSQMNDFVLKMHLDNGLLAEVWESEVRESLVDDNLSAMCRHWDLAEDCKVYLAGSSIHFDRRWVSRYFPKLEAALHYRMIDVSSFTTAFPGVLTKPDSGNHRAESDIDNSIAIQRQLMELVKEVTA